VEQFSDKGPKKNICPAELTRTVDGTPGYPGERVVGWGAGVIMGRYLVLVMPFVAIGGVVVYLLGIDREVPIWAIFIGPATVAGCFVLLAWGEAVQLPRELRISAEGITLVYGWPGKFEEGGAWKEWEPMAGSRVFWWVSFRYMNGAILYPVSPDQAREILIHPSCPNWDLPKGVLKAVGPL
jgi:hypothetical protein